MKIKINFVLICLLSTSSLVRAEIYKSTDEHGRVIYSNKPETSHSEILNIQNVDTEKNENYQKHLNKIEKLNEIYQEERLTKEEDKARKLLKKKELEKECTRAKIKLQKYKDARYLYIRTDDPKNPTIITAEERKKHTDKLEKEINKWCK